MKTLLILIFYFLSKNCFAQNLIVNGSFEEYYTCNGKLLPETPYGWLRVAKSGSGFYKGISSSTGLRNLDIIVGCNYREYRTYWETIMLQKLIKGDTYKISMSVATSFGIGPNLNDIGFYFSDNLITTSSIDTIMQPEKYFGFLDSKVIKKEDYWYRIEKKFIADGNYGILILGNFSKQDYQKITYNRNRDSKYITIHVDDIEIVPTEKTKYIKSGLTRDSIYCTSPLNGWTKLVNQFSHS